MILEEKIVKIIILISIFFGLYNLFGQFESFLTPFIFNYVTVGVVGLIFIYQNRKEEDLKLLSVFSLSNLGIALFSGQFTYLLNLFSKDKIEPLNQEFILLLIVILFMVSLIISLLKLIKINSDQNIKNKLLLQSVLFTIYLLSFFFRTGISDYLFLLFSLVFSINLLSNKMKMSPGIQRIILLVLLNCSLEILKLISIAFV